MNLAEIRELIGVCEAAYRQSAGPRDEMIWMATLGDLEFGVLRAAVVDWCRTSAFWPKPAELRARARLVMAEREIQRGKIRQLQERAKPQPHAQRTGAGMVRYVLQRLKDEGQDVKRGKFLGQERAAQIAEQAVTEWLEQTR